MKFVHCPRCGETDDIAFECYKCGNIVFECYECGNIAVAKRVDPKEVFDGD
jgi:uncharacterized Zn finger protein